MKKKLILLFLSIFCFALFGLAACTPSTGSSASNSGSTPTGEGKTDVEKSDIGTVLAQNTNNTDASVEGVVFGKTGDGFYVADSTGAVFVLSDSTVAVGDGVSVTGKFVLRNGEPTIRNAEVTKNSAGNEIKKATASTVSAIAALSSDDRTNYAAYYEVTAIVSKDAANRYVLSDDAAQIIVNSESNASALESWVGKKVVIKVVTHARATEGWTVSFVDTKDSVTEAAVDVATVKDAIFTEVSASMPTEVYGVLSLISSYEAEPGVVFTWTVTAGNTALSVKDNVPTVKEVTEDTSVTLKLTLTSGKSTADKSYTLTVKALRTVALSEIPSATFAEGENFYTQGTVVSKGRNQSGNIFSLVLMDGNSYVRADLSTRTEVDSYNYGDTVKVLGSYNENNAVEVISSKLVTAAAKDYKVDYSSLYSVNLSSASDYEAVAANGFTGAMLYKVTDPCFVYSGNTSYNYVRFGADVAQTTDGYGSPQKSFSLLIDGLEYTGVKDLFESLDINLKNDGAKQYYGYTMYAFVLYPGNTVLQFVVPGMDAVEYDESGVAKGEILSAVPTTTFDASAEGGSFTLPASTAAAGAITWTSSDAAIVIDGATATYTKQNSDGDVQVTLTASYTVNGAACSTDIVITLTAAPIVPVTISEAIEQGDGEIAALKGYVVGYAPGHSGSSTDASGFYITDGVNVLTVATVNGGVTVDGYNYKIGDATVSIGDEIVLKDLILSGKKLTCNEATKASVESTGNDTVNFELNASTVISSGEDLAAYMASITKLGSTANRTYEVVKVEASAENPIYIGATASYFQTFYYLDESKKESNTKKDSGYVLGDADATVGYIGTHARSLIATFDDEWILENTPIIKIDETSNYGATATITPGDKGVAGAYEFTGSFYFVFEYAGSAKYPYMYCGILNAGFELTPVTAA